MITRKFAEDAVFETENDIILFPVPSMINTLTVSVKYFPTQMIVLRNSVRGPSNSST